MYLVQYTFRRKNLHFKGNRILFTHRFIGTLSKPSAIILLFKQVTLKHVPRTAITGQETLMRHEKVCLKAISYRVLQRNKWFGLASWITSPAVTIGTWWGTKQLRTIRFEVEMVYSECYCLLVFNWWDFLVMWAGGVWDINEVLFVCISTDMLSMLDSEFGLSILVKVILRVVNRVLMVLEKWF